MQLSREKNPSEILTVSTERQPIRNNLTAFIETLVKEEVERAIEKLKSSYNLTKLIEDETNPSIKANSSTTVSSKKVKPHQVYYIRRRPDFIPARPFAFEAPGDVSFYGPQKFLHRAIRALSPTLPDLSEIYVNSDKILPRYI